MTATSRIKAKNRKRVLTDSYGLEIVLRVGDTMRSKGVVKTTDVLTKSENKSHSRSVRMRELVDYGFLVEVEEDSHQHQVRHYDLTEDGWKIWTAVSEIRSAELPTKTRKWSDAEQRYIEVD